MEKEIRHETYNALLRNVSGPYNTCNNYDIYIISTKYKIPVPSQETVLLS
jgi:hypothetical protein